MPPRKAIAIGERFGRLIALQLIRSKSAKRSVFSCRCRCDCGARLDVVENNLRTGNTQSCGCLQREVMSERITHGHARQDQHSAEYRTWQGILTRCTNVHVRSWKNYGGRGIAVCERWQKSFDAFLADVGPRPSAKHSIDRFPNNDGDYEPGNVRWATKQEQRANQRPRKLSPLDVDHIRILAGQGWMLKVIARLYNVTGGHISEVVAGKVHRGGLVDACS